MKIRSRLKRHKRLERLQCGGWIPLTPGAACALGRTLISRRTLSVRNQRFPSAFSMLNGKA